MTVAPDSPHRLDHEGRQYRFCCAGCLAKFQADPARYGTRVSSKEPQPGGQAAAPPAAPPGTDYTCPMHPEVVRPGPGACPICGMALEPRTVSFEAPQEDDRELVGMTRRFRVSAVLTVPLLLFVMGEYLPGRVVETLASPSAVTWIGLLLASPVVLWGGWPFFVRGWQSIVNRSLNMFTLIGLGVGVAYVYSLVATVAPGLFPAAFRDASGTVAVYFEAAAVIVTLVLLGQVLELRARSQTGAAIRALLGLAPKTARRLEDGGAEQDVPLAAAIVNGALARNVQLADAGAFESKTGKGVVGTVDGREVALGNQSLLDDLGVDPGALAARAETLRADGQTVMFVVVDGVAAGLLGVADPIKPTTAEAIRQLHAEGLRIAMLTGDNRTTAESVARKLGIDEVVAEVLPDQKADAIRRFQAEGSVVAMAGDGINDAPALAQADVGVAMGTGTDVAMESAGVTLVKGDLRGIVRARRLSRATIRNIKQNLFFAFVHNALGVPIAAGVLYPVFGLLLSPAIAAAAMSFSSVSVIGNALRLRRASL